MAKQGTVSLARNITRTVLSQSVLSAAILSAVLFSVPAFAGEALAPPAPSSLGSLPNASNPASNSSMGQMMAMQQAVMNQAATGTSNFDGNLPKSTSLSANFGWMDTFDNPLLNGGYGGGVTATHWITSHFALTASIEIMSFGFGPSTQSALNGLQAGTPIIPITLGAVYDFTGGKNWINPQIFGDAGPAVSLYGQSMPLYFDLGAGITTPLAKISDTLTGINLFANIRVAYLDQIGGALSQLGTALAGGTNTFNNSSMWFMPIEFGATFVF